MENYNRQLRVSLENYISGCMNQGFDLRESAINFSHVLYKLENTENPFEMLYREYMISVSFLDAYKIYLYRQQECISNDEETDFLGQLVDIEDLDDLLAEVSCNPDFLTKIIESCYNFRQLGSLGKINLVKSLNDVENEWLLEKFPMHKQDLETYDIEVSLEHIINYIKNQRTHQRKECNYEYLDAIVINVLGFIQNLTNYDYINAENLLIDIARKDYSASKCLNGHSKECDMFLEHIDLYENFSRNDILATLMENRVFLKDAIFDITCVYALEEYDGLTINKEKIDDCEDTEVMKKLIIN